MISIARRKNTRRRGGKHTRVPLDLGVLADDPSLSSVSAIDQAIDELEHRSPRTAEVVRLRFFARLTEPQVAQVMHTSERTVRRD